MVDKSINKGYMEMYAENSSRGGVLEPSGLVGVRFGGPKLAALARRFGDDVQNDGALRAVYLQIAEKFADLHDVPQRMLATRTIDGIVPWRSARSFFYWRLRRRLLEASLVDDIGRKGLEELTQRFDDDATDVELLRSVFVERFGNDVDERHLDCLQGNADDDLFVVEWIEENAGRIRSVGERARVSGIARAWARSLTPDTLGSVIDAIPESVRDRLREMLHTKVTERGDSAEGSLSSP